ncbi:hypothetical protein GJ496_001291 [Pomphorhynchus laevis]|nr:hypothetical protein GJ496_001291 [Pomphorhynchus laevis]
MALSSDLSYADCTRTIRNRLCDIRCYPQILPVKMNLVEWQILCSSAIATLPPIWHFSHPQKKTSIVTLPTLLKDVLQDSQSSSSIRTVDQNKIKKKM